MAEELFRRRVIRMLVRRGRLEAAAAAGLLSWPHSGFSVHHAIRVEPWDTEGVEQLCRYLVHPLTPGLHLTRLYSAYTSDESGGVEVYLRIIDASREGKVPVRRVSNEGGAHPRWSRKATRCSISTWPERSRA